MIQDQYSLDPLSKYLKEHPKAKNKELYTICHAENDSQKTAVRTKKSRFLKRKNDTDSRKSDTKSSGPMQKLSREDLEKRIVDALNRHPDNAQILGKAIEFFIKVKGKTETISDTIDMEALRQIGVNIKRSG